MKLIIRYIVLIFFVFVANINTGIGQEPTEIWYKLSAEIAFSFEKNPLDIRWRPDDHIFLPKKYVAAFADKNNIARTDLMLGVKLGMFNIYNYSKFDEFGEGWTGFRFDWNSAILKKKLLIHLQERYFWALTDRASNHYYLIQYIRYVVFKNIQAGFLGYGKWKPDKPFDTGQWFMGPVVNFDLPWHISINLAYTNDVFNKHIYMAYFKTTYKIKFKKKVLTFTD